ASTCCCHVGPGGGGGGALGGAPPGPPRPPGNPPNPNSSIPGTGPRASAGVLSDNRMSTVICGYPELSTCPISFFVITGTSPLFSRTVSVTSHVTFGVILGTRP